MVPSLHVRGNTHVQARNNIIVAHRRDEESLLLDGGTTKKSNGDRGKTKRLILRMILIRAKKIGFWIIIVACLSLGFVMLSYAIGPSNFILWGVLDSSFLLRQSPFYCQQSLLAWTGHGNTHTSIRLRISDL